MLSLNAMSGLFAVHIILLSASLVMFGVETFVAQLTGRRIKTQSAEEELKRAIHFIDEYEELRLKYRDLLVGQI
jgi:hypothetical protein